jgi:cellulose synthase/poly-beta-1,6-N-acetylglucosamine synthase-like glycosyltransferase
VLFYLFIDQYNHYNKDVSQLSSLVSQIAVKELYAQYKNYTIAPRKKSNKDMMLFMIRAYNEEKTIGSVIDTIIKAGYHKILVINDGSTDATADILHSKQKENPDVLLLVAHHMINRGGGAANKTGFSFASTYGKEL